MLYLKLILLKFLIILKVEGSYKNKVLFELLESNNLNCIKFFTKIFKQSEVKQERLLLFIPKRLINETCFEYILNHYHNSDSYHYALELIASNYIRTKKFNLLYLFFNSKNFVITNLDFFMEKLGYLFEDNIFLKEKHINKIFSLDNFVKNIHLESISNLEYYPKFKEHYQKIANKNKIENF